MYEWNDGTMVLVHHGIRGQKWGVRRYQNPDGSLTAEGRRRYGFATEGNVKKQYQNARSEYRSLKSKAYDDMLRGKKTTGEDVANVRNAKQKMDAARKNYMTSDDYAKNKAAEQKVWKDARRESIRNRGAGEQVLGFMLMGPIGLYNYNSLRTTGDSVISAGAKAVATAWTTGGLGNIVYSTYIGNKAKEDY